MNEIIKQLNEIALEENWGTVDRIDGKPKAIVVIANAIAEITRLEKELEQTKKQDNTQPMTNRQWLETLSDEEFMENGFSDICKHCGNNSNCGGWNAETVCKEGIVKWLKAEHKESEQ